MSPPQPKQKLLISDRNHSDSYAVVETRYRPQSLYQPKTQTYIPPTRPQSYISYPQWLMVCPHCNISNTVFTYDVQMCGYCRGLFK